MWYKISCWKPENNSQLLFSALHPGSLSAQGSWQGLSGEQRTPRTYPSTGRKIMVKLALLTWLFRWYPVDIFLYVPFCLPFLPLSPSLVFSVASPQLGEQLLFLDCSINQLLTDLQD